MSTSDYRPQKLLCVVAHPDDIEVMIGGTIAAWTAAGTEVCYLICTNGANGTGEIEKTGKEISTIRAKEQKAAADALGVGCVHQLDYRDGSVELKDDLRRDIVRHIRAHTPDAVFTIDPTFLYSTRFNYPNHRDHRVIGQATFDAVYPMARDVGTFPELLAENLQPHKVQTLLMGNYNEQNCYFDISRSIDAKATALKCHVSQFGDAEGVIRHCRSMAEACGEEAGVELAEGFIKLDIGIGG